MEGVEGPMGDAGPQVLPVGDPGAPQGRNAGPAQGATVRTSPH